MAKSPAFQYYPGDWLAGTLTMSLEAEAAYTRCINHQWLAGGVPADDLDELAGVIRVPKAKAAALWAVVGKKFQRGDDGLWRNERLEAERQKQDAYRESMAQNGRASGAARRERRLNRGSTTVQSGSQSVRDSFEPNHEPNRTLQSSSSVPLSVKNTERGARVAPRYGGDAMNQRLDRNAVALIIPREGQAISIPAQWWDRVKREYGLAEADVDVFAKWAGPVVAAEGLNDGGKRLAWLDGMLARWRAEKTKPANDGYVPWKDFVAAQDAAWASIEVPDGETARATLREAYKGRKLPPVASHG